MNDFKFEELYVGQEIQFTAGGGVCVLLMK